MPEQLAPGSTFRLERAMLERVTPEIQLEFVYTRGDALRANEQILTETLKGRLRRWFIYGVVLLVIAAVIAVHGYGATGQVPALSFLLLAMGVLFLCIKRLMIWFATRSFHKQPFANQAVRWSITADRLVVGSSAGDSTLEWSGVIKARESKKGFLLFLTPARAQWIPHSAFAGDGDREQLRSWLREKSIDNRRV